MAYIIYIASVVTGLVKKNSKVALLLVFVTMWLLSAFASGNADSGIYENRYYFYETFEGQTEFGFQAVMALFSSLGISYEAYRMVIIALELFLITVAVRRITDSVV